MTRLSLRLRIFLFFGLMAAGSVAVAAGALALGWSRAQPSVPVAPFVTSAVAFALVNTGLLVVIWLLFDENVAKPITRLSADLRLRAHSGAAGELDTDAARYLGDLAPAAAALLAKSDVSIEHTAQRVAQETERLTMERERLTALLTESPVATILINPAREIVLYDAQAAAILATVAPPRLKAPLSDYVEASDLDRALATGHDTPRDVETLGLLGTPHSVSVRLKALGETGHILFFDPEDTPGIQHSARPLVFNFDLLTEQAAQSRSTTPLDALPFVVLDLETTGLSVETDDIVQIGAVRVLGTAPVAGEVLSTFVDPGRPIPPASTRIHKVADADVVGAPRPPEALARLHHFARDAVLVAHNAPFDIGLLKRHGADSGLSWDHPVLDTVLLSAVAFGVTEDHSLDGLCNRLSVTIAPEDRHTAYGDAKATAEALVKLLAMLKAQGFHTLADLQPALQREARRLYTSA